MDTILITYFCHILSLIPPLRGAMAQAAVGEHMASVAVDAGTFAACLVLATCWLSFFHMTRAYPADCKQFTSKVTVTYKPSDKVPC